MSRHGRFTPAADVLRATIREVGEGRGFAATRILTHWAEIVGADVAAVARPLEVRHGPPRAGPSRSGPSRSGRARPDAPPEGATLTILALGAAALRLDMERERILERVNACYGYRAVGRIRIRQGGPEEFGGPPPAPSPPAPDAGRLEAALEGTAGVRDTELRLALAALAANVLSRSRP